MHKNYNSCLHILDMQVERSETSVFNRKQILVLFAVTEAAVVSRGDPKTSLRTSFIVQIMFPFRSAISDNILRTSNQKFISVKINFLTSV